MIISVFGASAEKLLFFHPVPIPKENTERKKNIKSPSR